MTTDSQDTVQTPVDESKNIINHEEVINMNQKLLNSIASGDYKTYSDLCAEDFTCVEPESSGMLIKGLDFHKYYFDLASTSSQDKTFSGFHQIHMSNPHVRILGDTAAVITYVRVDQVLNTTSIPVTKTTSETRIWEQRNGRLVHIHFHKSIC